MAMNEKKERKPYKTSKREKVLIGFLIILVFGVSYVLFLLLPAFEKLGSAADQLEVTRDMYESTKARALTAPVVKAQADEQKALMEELGERLEIFVDTEILEREFTRFMVDNNLATGGISFSIGSGGAIRTLYFQDISALRRAIGSLPDNELITLVLNISAKATDLPTILKLPEYVNGIYSYRLLSAGITAGDARNPETSATFIVEAILRTN